MRKLAILAAVAASSLFVPSSPSFACTQGETYCENSYHYYCQCTTGQPCVWVQFGRCHHDDQPDGPVTFNLQRLRTPGPAIRINFADAMALVRR